MGGLKQQLADKTRVQILPGQHFVASDDRILSTLLGSCVAACLYDPVNRIVGMNHFLLVNNRYPKDANLILAEAGRYGVHAMELLINDMLKRGADKRQMKAKAFGGGSILQSQDRADNFNCVGNVNARFIREFLANEKIPLVAADLGGDRGRIIHFFTNDYSVYMRKIQRTISVNIAGKEKAWWQKSLKTQKPPATDLDLWG